jgi:hypothetical protein
MMSTSEERAFEEEHAHLSAICAELADLQEQAIELGREAERLINERRELRLQQAAIETPQRKRARGCLRAAG